MTGTRMERTVGPVLAGLARSSCAVAFACGLLAAPAAARADEQIVDAAPAPIVRVNVREGDVTIRTWDRQAVGIDGDSTLDIEKRTVQSGQNGQIAIPQIALDGNTELPPESFVTGPIPPGPRDVVLVKSGLSTMRGPVIVTVPNDAIFVYARAGSGSLSVSDYRGGTLVAAARAGPMFLNDVGGTVFAQTWRGALVVRGSTLDRIRARSLTGNVDFERCNARQIEATTIGGSIVYDGGSFAPGLARFESTRGDVAIGATGGVQYGAHVLGAGRVFTNFNARAQVDETAAATNAVVAGGGPLVTATTQGGNVFLYDGSLRNRVQLPPEWQPAVQMLQRPGAPAIPSARYAPGRYAPQRYAPPRYAPPRDAPARYVPPRLGQRAAPRRFTPPRAFERFRRERPRPR